jgi:hypothetical protein
MVKLMCTTPDSEDWRVTFPFQTRSDPLHIPSHWGDSFSKHFNQLVSSLWCQNINTAATTSYWYFPACRSCIGMATRCKFCKLSFNWLRIRRSTGRLTVRTSMPHQFQSKMPKHIFFSIAFRCCKLIAQTIRK